MKRGKDARFLTIEWGQSFSFLLESNTMGGSILLGGSTHEDAKVSFSVV